MSDPQNNPEAAGHPETTQAAQADDAHTSPHQTQDAQTDALAALAQRVYGEIGRKLKFEGSGGAADSSFAAGVFKPTLDGLGIIGGNAHTAEEYAEVESMVPRFYLLTRMVMELSASGGSVP